jgi:hypothetical protein
LNLGLVWNSFEVRVEDAALCVKGLPMAIAEGRGVEEACQFSLGSRGEAGLRLDANHVVVVESVADCLKVRIRQILDVNIGQSCAKVDRGA